MRAKKLDSVEFSADGPYLTPVYSPGEVNPERDVAIIDDEDDSSNSPLTESVLASSLPSSTSKALSALCREYKRLGVLISNYQKDQKDLKLEIEELALSISAKKIIGDGWNTTRQQKTTSEIDQKKLMEESVSRDYDPVTVQEIITAATVEKKGKEYVTVTTGKDKEEEKSSNGK